MTTLSPMTPLKPCHEEGVYLFNVGKAQIHAGAISARLMKPQWDLVVNLTGTSQMSPIITGFNGAQKIAKQFIQGAPVYPGYPELVIEWSDGRTPDVTRKEWKRLITDLSVFDGRVLIHCIGGHGRTGTLLVILSSLSGALKGDPVSWVRENYCKKTIETQEQIEYLQKDIHIKTTQLPRRIPYTHQVTPLNGDIPVRIGAWWSREDYPTGEPSNDSGLYRCVLCMIHKKKILMHSAFLDGTGYCFTCNADAHAAMGGG